MRKPDPGSYHLNQANKLSRTYSTLLEALNRHRGKGQQKVTVEHVHVHQGGQAIVGNVERGPQTERPGCPNLDDKQKQAVSRSMSANDPKQT